MNDQPFDIMQGKYRIIESVGGGAMGEVFKAEHIRMQKVVAIKILHRNVSDNTEIIERFKREARAAAAIDHANICNVMDFDITDEGDFYLVMEYLEGDTLKKRISEKGTIPPNEAVFIMLQLLSVLQCAHEKGIVHRDIKPENIALISKDGTNDFVKLLDFGIAHEDASRQPDDDDDAIKTKMGLMYGTPEYIAPEQANGLEIDGRVDLYACGIILYEMLTGHVPFQSESFVNVIHQQIFAPPPHILDTKIDFANQFDIIIQKLLEKDKEKRYHNPSEVIEALRSIPLHPFANSGNYSPNSEDIINYEALSKKSAEMISKARDMAQKSISQFENSELKVQSDKFISQIPKSVRVLFIATISLILLLSAILIFSPEKELQLIEIAKEHDNLIVPELKKNKNIQPYIYDESFAPLTDETLKNDPNILKAFDYYQKKNEQLCYDYLTMVETRYAKHPNYLRYKLQAAAMLVRAKQKTAAKDSKFVDDLVLSMEIDFAKLAMLVPDAAKNEAVTEALHLLFPDNKKSDWKIPDWAAFDQNKLASAMAWAILYSPYDQYETRKKRMFETYDALENKSVPDWQKQMLEVWRLEKDKCKARYEIIFDILNQPVNKKDLYDGVLSPLYKALRLNVKSESKRYQCKANFLQFRDCNYCMKSWIIQGYEAWTELNNTGNLENATLDFLPPKEEP